MGICTCFIILLWSAFAPRFAYCQQDSSIQRKQIAIFVPLYLDSAFDASGNYRFGKTMPSYFSQGLDFYQGVQLAIDSLSKEKVPVDIHIYDSRTGNNKPDLLAQDSNFKKMNLILGHVNMNEATALARIASTIKVPFININLPNDAGISGNPEYVILNPTLSTHANGLYRFIQKNYALSPLLYIRKKGVQEDRLKKYFSDIEKSTPSVHLKMREIILGDSVDTQQLKKLLDSSKNTVCIIGSLEQNFGTTICRQLAALSKMYKTTVMGPPTWEQMDFTKPIYKGVDIIYSSPNFFNPDNKLVAWLQSYYKARYFSRVSEWVYKGFEITYLLAHAANSEKLLNEKNNTLFGEIDIEPVYNKQSGAIDYYENKMLYFIRKTDGIIKAVF